MICSYSNTVALKYGINSALIAEYICGQLYIADIVIDDLPWVRVTQKFLTGIYPFVGEKAVRNALHKLKKANIIKAKQFNKGRFDHGCFYTITSYGYKVMREDDDFE